MIDEKHFELINRFIDGDLSADESRQLLEFLSKNPEAMQIYQELEKTADFLKEMPEVEPPITLKQHILKSIQTKKRQEPAARFSFFSIFKGGQRRPNFRLGLAFAAGIVFGLIIYSLFVSPPSQGSFMPTNNMYGTIGILEKAEPVIIKEVPIELSGFLGAARLVSFKNLYGIEIQTNASLPSQVVLRFESSQLGFAGFLPAENTNTSFKIEMSRITANLASYSKAIFLFSRRGSTRTPISVKIQTSEGEIFFHSFSIAPN